MKIKELRKEKGLTQKQVSEITGIPLRTYKNYENDSNKEGSIKYNYIVNELENYGYVDESHGILELEDIKQKCKDVFKEYDVNYCVLFGSYAQGTADETSDVDLLISTNVSGMQFFGLAEKMREKLKKKIDLLDSKQLLNNEELLDNILKEGIKIYEKE